MYKLISLILIITLIICCKKDLTEPDSLPKYQLEKTSEITYIWVNTVLKKTSYGEIQLAGTNNNNLYVYNITEDLSIKKVLTAENILLTSIQDFAETQLGNFYLLGNEGKILMFFDEELNLNWELPLKDSITSYGEHISFVNGSSENIYLAGNKMSQYSSQKVPVNKLAVFIIDTNSNITEIFDYDDYNYDPNNPGKFYRGTEAVQVEKNDSVLSVLYIRTEGTFGWRFARFAQFDMEGNLQWHTEDIIFHIGWLKMFPINNNYLILSALEKNDCQDSPRFRLSSVNNEGCVNTVFNSRHNTRPFTYQKTLDNKFLIFCKDLIQENIYTIFCFDEEGEFISQSDLELDYSINNKSFVSFIESEIYILGTKAGKLEIMKYEKR